MLYLILLYEETSLKKRINEIPQFERASYILPPVKSFYFIKPFVQQEGEILNDQRRLAVSVTRAKHKFIVVGNSRALQRYEPLQRLINACTPLAVDKDVLSSVVDKYKKEFV